MKLMTIAALAAVTLAFAAPAQAQQAPTPDQTLKEIKATFGFVPSYAKAYPKTSIAGAWAFTKGVMAPDSKLEPKVKALINLAVAAQIPCQYCVWLETKTAKQAGASDDEVAEAVVQAAYVRHWSTVLNGLQTDFATFKSEFGGD